MSNHTPPEKRADAWIQVRVKREDKAGWVKQAQREGKNLSQWVIDTLNQRPCDRQD